jgi:hypothetical protein
MLQLPCMDFLKYGRFPRMMFIVFRRNILAYQIFLCRNYLNGFTEGLKLLSFLYRLHAK